MVRKVFFYMLMFWVLISCKKNGEDQTNVDILDKLRALNGVSVVEIQPLYGFPRAFQIDITQPIDHHNPGGPKFSQRIYLHHSDESLPMVLRTSGYTTSLRQKRRYI